MIMKYNPLILTKMICFTFFMHHQSSPTFKGIEMAYDCEKLISSNTNVEARWLTAKLNKLGSANQVANQINNPHIAEVFQVVASL
jgi:hypothetical protein